MFHWNKNSYVQCLLSQPPWPPLKMPKNKPTLYIGCAHQKSKASFTVHGVIMSHSFLYPWDTILTNPTSTLTWKVSIGWLMFQKAEKGNVTELSLMEDTCPQLCTYYFYSQSLATYDNTLLYTCSEGDINIWGDILVTKGSYTMENKVINISFDDIKLVEIVLWWWVA